MAADPKTSASPLALAAGEGQPLSPVGAIRARAALALRPKAALDFALKELREKRPIPLVTQALSEVVAMQIILLAAVGQDPDRTAFNFCQAVVAGVQGGMAEIAAKQQRPA